MKRKLSHLLRKINIQRPIKPTDIWLAPADFFHDRANITSVFTKIYAANVWGANHSSGGGSAPKVVSKYIDYLRSFLSDHNISSVVDFGCGDWQFSKLIDWSGIDYLGIDVVNYIVENNKEKYQRDNVRFQCLDLFEKGFDSIPNADLFIAKDVFQHLSNNNVLTILNGTHSKFKFALITNDFSYENVDIENGDTRPMNLQAEPFNVVSAKPVLHFQGKTTFLLAED